MRVNPRTGPEARPSGKATVPPHALGVTAEASPLDDLSRSFARGLPRRHLLQMLTAFVATATAGRLLRQAVPTASAQQGCDLVTMWDCSANAEEDFLGELVLVCMAPGAIALSIATGPVGPALYYAACSAKIYWDLIKTSRRCREAPCVAIGSAGQCTAFQNVTTAKGICCTGTDVACRGPSGDFCIALGRGCCGTMSCAFGETCCNQDHCCAPRYTCCGTLQRCCDPTQVCHQGNCCDSDDVLCPDGTCCPQGYRCTPYPGGTHCT